MTAILIREKIYVDYNKINKSRDTEKQYKQIVDQLYSSAGKIEGCGWNQWILY